MLRLAWLVLLVAACRTSHAIIGSSPTTIQKHPYTVAVDQVIPVYDEDDIIDYDISMLCAGALLGKKTVVTAASCFNGADDLKNITNVRVRVGSQFREGGGEAYAVSSFQVHPDWDGYDADNVMLLILEEEVVPRTEVRAAALAAPAPLSAGQKLIMTGYGDLREGEVLPDGQVRQIQVATLSFVNQDLCEDVYYFYSGTTLGCAGGAGIGMGGNRDVGDPLMNWRGELVGLAVQQGSVQGMSTTFTNLVLPALNTWVRDNVDVELPDDGADLAAKVAAVAVRKRRT